MIFKTLPEQGLIIPKAVGILGVELHSSVPIASPAPATDAQAAAPEPRAAAHEDTAETPNVTKPELDRALIESYRAGLKLKLRADGIELLGALDTAQAQAVIDLLRTDKQVVIDRLMGLEKLYLKRPADRPVELLALAEIAARLTAYLDGESLSHNDMMRLMWMVEGQNLRDKVRMLATSEGKGTWELDNAKAMLALVRKLLSSLEETSEREELVTA